MSEDPFDETIQVYEQKTKEWIAERKRYAPAETDTLVQRKTDGPIIDLGCGPGWNLPDFGPDSIGLDASAEMARQAAAAHGDHTIVQARLEDLPFADGRLGGAWASRSYVHLVATAIPLALGELHRALAIDAPITLIVFGSPGQTTVNHRRSSGDKYEGRWYNSWDPEHFADVVIGAGFGIDSIDTRDDTIYLTAHKLHTLSDTVGPNMKLLICGLNPSPASSNARVGYARPGNRFWPAALAAGLVSEDRDPLHALIHHGMGMTDLVKRTTRRADEVSRSEFAGGLHRIDRMARWLEPKAVCVIGLAGWRAAADPKAKRGWQETQLGGRPVYLMPATSGLNAHDTIESLTEHLRQATAL